MGVFHSDLSLTRSISESRKYRLGDSLVWESYDKKILVKVAAGFETDGASVPSALWWFASPFTGDHVPAAVIHDALYSAKVTTRKEADECFLEAMEDCGASGLRAWLLYSAVRLGGGKAWRKFGEQYHFVTIKTDPGY